MQSNRRRLGHVIVLALATAALACGPDGPSAPRDASKENTPATPDSPGQTRSDAVGLAVTPGALVLRVGTTGSLAAAFFDASGAVVEVPTGALPWTSSNAAVATVSESGIVAAVAEGETTVSTTARGFSGSARVIVTR